MKVIVVENSWFANMIVGKNITLYPFIFLLTSKEQATIDRILHHEYVHILQVRELGFFKFYSLYILEFFQNLVKYRDTQLAYENISFEIEAYQNMHTQELPDPLV